MEFEQTIKARHSVRKFTNQKVSLAVIKSILTDAQLAPSWVNSQPYQMSEHHLNRFGHNKRNWIMSGRRAHPIYH